MQSSFVCCCVFCFNLDVSSGFDYLLVVSSDFHHLLVRHLVGAAEVLITQLEKRFPASTLMDAFGIVYLQYWMVARAEENFAWHLKIIKEQYAYTMKFPKLKVKKGQKDVGEVTEDEETKSVEPILSAAKLDEQAQMFVITMKANWQGAMNGDLPLNPLTRLWRRLEASGLLRHKLSEYLKVVEMAVVTVLGSVEDKRTFSILSFMKNKLRNQLSVHLPMVVAMHAQEHYGLTDFPYSAAYDQWKLHLRKADKHACCAGSSVYDESGLWSWRLLPLRSTIYS